MQDAMAIDEMLQGTGRRAMVFLQVLQQFKSATTHQCG